MKTTRSLFCIALWLALLLFGTPAGSNVTVPYATAGGTPVTITIAVLTATAQVVSMNRLDPNPTTAATVRWEVVFRVPVSGVFPQNFWVGNWAGLIPGPSIASVTPGADCAHWTMTVNTAGEGSGGVTLYLAAHVVESPAVSNLFNGQTYDINPPTASRRAARFVGKFRNTGSAADNAIPFLDGVPNLLKHAFNLNATVPEKTPTATASNQDFPISPPDAEPSGTSAMKSS